MKNILLFFVLACCVWASKPAHPRLMGASSMALGAIDGSTVGSMRWKAANGATDVGWQTACAAADYVYSLTPSSSAAHFDFAVELVAQYLVLNTYTGPTAPCGHSASQYGAQGLLWIEDSI